MFSIYRLDEQSWKRWQSAAEGCQRWLTAQEITLGNPGAILRDVEMLLEFVGPGGVVTKSRNASLPCERLPELNARSSHPIELDLKRALLRDYPNLAGTFILLRVMDLLQMQGSRLVVAPAAREFWRGLNPTERYFALLEALLFHAQSSVLGGERRGDEPQKFESVAIFLGQLTERWRNFDHYVSVRVFGPQGQIPPWSLFVQRQLGLIEIRPRACSEKERRDWGGRGWLLGGARLTAWGTAVTWALLEFLKTSVESEEESESDEAVPDAGAQRVDSGGAELAEDEPEAPDESGLEAEFGTLQPVFQPYFPAWQAVYARPNRAPRLGTHIFKVSLVGWRGGGGVWRRLAAPPDASLDELAGAILDAFKLDEEHLYDFRYRDQRGKSRTYHHPYCDEGPFTPDITVGQTDLACRDKMRFTFDYGDNWQFDARLETIEAGPSLAGQITVIESVGEAPAQYPQGEG